ncbi:hypothetical protein ACOSP6_01830 [Tenacibaculum sp. MEBiC06402]|uniref:hypothetical protein n=1 Tax=unclassified Tenacibaculum TaxID=2635139 RepID=UPI003B9D5FEE
MKEFSNRVSLRKDRKNLYIELLVQSSAIARFALLILCFLVASVLFYFMFFIAKNSEFNQETIIPFLFLLGVNVWLIRSYLWNRYGKEYLIISKKSFSYYYDYGLIQTKKTTFKCNELTIKIVKLNSEHTKSTLAFFRFNEENDLQEEMHPTSVYIRDEDINYLVNEIYNFLDIDIEKDEDFGGFHYN